MKKKYYAYFINENTFGIVESWPMCQEICKGVKSKYKSFDTKEKAESWLKGDSEIETKSKIKKYYAVHFVDSRTEKIYYDWDKCQKEIKDKKTRYKRSSDLKRVQKARIREQRKKRGVFL